MKQLLLGIAVASCLASSSGAQGFGGAGNFDAGGRHRNLSAGSPGNLLFEPLTTEAAQTVIVVSATAERRVVPTQLRVVLAVVSAGKSAEECQQNNAEKLEGVRKAWQELQIPDDSIVEDFISVLPVYEWETEVREGEKYDIQQLSGYRMQSNLHVTVPNEAAAMTAIRQAFKQGVTDIVTFDYWASDLDDQQAAARQLALEAAKKKADLLLSVFDQRPPIINIQEQTSTFLPHSLYTTYVNVLEEEQSSSSDRGRRSIKAYRPKLSYFDGLQIQSDVRPRQPPLRPEINIVSTVKLYFQSPAAAAADED